MPHPEDTAEGEAASEASVGRGNRRFPLRGLTYRHKELAAGRWSRLAFLEQMANVGSEVERALNWRLKQNLAFSQRAFERALELIDLTLAGAEGLARLRELARVREAMVDYFAGDNRYGSSEVLWRRYFSPFTYAARRHR